jgi:hypothetical protein
MVKVDLRIQFKISVMKRVWKIKTIVLRFLILKTMLMFAEKVWLGLEWREQEECLGPKHAKMKEEK